MANTLLVSGSNALYAQSTTASFAPIGVGYNGATPNLTETDVQIIQRTAGVYSQLSANCTTHTSNTIISLHKNASAAGINETITISATGVTTDSTHTDTVTAADKWNYTLSNLASSFSLFSNVFAATTNTVCRFVTYQNTGSTVAGAATDYMTLMGRSSVTATLANSQITFQKAGTLKNLAVNVGSGNSCTGASFIRTAKGATPTIGNCSISLTGLGAGIVEDTSHTDAVVAADLWSMQVLVVTGDTASYLSAAIDFVSTSGDSIQGCGNSAGVGFVKSVTRPHPLGSEIFSNTTNTDALVQDTVQDAYVYSNTYVNTKTFVNADTITLEANGAAAGSISVVTAGTGNTGDTTHTYTAATTDKMNFSMATGATTGTRSITAFWVHANLTSAIIPTYFDLWPLTQFVEM